MTSIDYASWTQVVQPQSVETIPFQPFDGTASASLSWPRAPLPHGEVFRLIVGGRRLMTDDEQQLGPVDEEDVAEVRRQWPA